MRKAERLVLDRLEELHQYDTTLEKYLLTSSRNLRSVLECLIYNICLERSLIRRFAIINDDEPYSYLQIVSDVNIYDTTGHKWVNGKPSFEPNHCWSEGSFKETKYDSSSKWHTSDVYGKYMYFSDEITFLRERQLIDRFMPEINNIIEYDWEKIAITLNNETHGAGKTSAIQKHHRKNIDIVATATSAGKNEYTKLNINFDKDYYRTYGSILIDGAPTAEVIWADEGLMVHAGDILLCAYITKCKTVKIYGDSKKTPFVNRASEFTLYYGVLPMNNIETQSESHRANQAIVDGHASSENVAIERLENTLKPIPFAQPNVPEKLINDFHIYEDYKYRSEDDIDFAEWVLLHTPCYHDIDLTYQTTTYVTKWPEDIHIPRDISLQEVQLKYDAIFMPIIEQNKKDLQDRDPFPLERQVKTDNQTEYLIPKLKTVLPFRNLGALATAINVIRQIHVDPPTPHVTRNPNLIQKVIDNFFDTYINESKLNNYKLFIDFSSKQHLKDWFFTKTPTRRKALNACQRHMPDQVITSHNPLVTAKYATMGSYVTKILKASLKSKWCINDGLSQEELNGCINKMLLGAKNAIPQEADFSKFEKSQEEYCLRVTIGILKRLGIDDHTCDGWFNAHTLDLLSYHAKGIHTKTKFQRRGGDVLTFVGNTLVMMATLAFTHDYDNAFGGVFGGEDSLVFLQKNNLVGDQAKIVGDMFYLTAKLECFPKAITFASKFLVFVNGNYYLTPDPIKAVTRLGKHNMHCDEHNALAWASFADYHKCYLNADVRREVAKCATERHKHMMNCPIHDVEMLCEFIAKLVLSKKSFMNLFDGPFLLRRWLPKAMKEVMCSMRSRRSAAITEEEMEVLFDDGVFEQAASTGAHES